MASRGRPRKDSDDFRLPKYVYLKKGRYVYVPYLGYGKIGKEIVLCSGDADLKEIWRTYDALTEDQTKGTLKWLCERYLESLDHKDKHIATQKEYMKCHERVISAVLSNGKKFGDVRFDHVTPGVLRKYRDSRARTARVRANRELAYLSVVFAWAYEIDWVKSNPVKGVKRLKEKPRTRYVEDWEYAHVYNKAKSPHYIRTAMELAYLMRLRLSEILALQYSDLTEEGVLARRTKGSKTQIISWSDRLRRAIESASGPTTVKSFCVIHDRRGQPIRASTFQTAWNRLMREALEDGLKERFTFHDLKAKGVTDFEGDKCKAAGHKSARMADVYNRKPEKTSATK